MAISGWGVFLIIFFLVLILGGGGYVLYAHYRARKLGLPPPNFNPFNKKTGGDSSTYRAPAPAPGGIQGWIQDRWSALRSGRTAGGAYESAGLRSGGADGGRRGFGPLDPDEAWDARVDHEAGGYYEEQELGLQDPSHGPYGGDGYGGDVGVEEGRGRSRSRQRDLGDGYDERSLGVKGNPFGDGAEASSMSLRSVSPRPEIQTNQPRAPSHKRGQSSLHTSGSQDDSPTERRSMFREDV